MKIAVNVNDWKVAPVEEADGTVYGVQKDSRSERVTAINSAYCFLSPVWSKTLFM